MSKKMCSCVTYRPADPPAPLDLGESRKRTLAARALRLCDRLVAMPGVYDPEIGVPHCNVDCPICNGVGRIDEQAGVKNGS